MFYHRKENFSELMFNTNTSHRKKTTPVLEPHESFPEINWQQTVRVKPTLL
jgi:hypothetical protein